MELAHTKVTCSKQSETFTIHHLTDLHDGSPDHAKEALDNRISMIANDPNALWIGGGDYGDLILPTDKRFTPGVVADEWMDAMARIPDFYLERLTERLAPIADKCIGLVSGNHEATIGKNYHRGVAAELAMRLGIPTKYLGDRGWSIVTFERNESRVPLRCYSYHGWSAGRLKGRKALQAERDLGAWNADAFFLGHDHQPYSDIWYTEETYGTKSGYMLRQRPRCVLNGGSWTFGQKHPSTETEKRAWRPSTAPGQSWLEGKNFRPQPPCSPVLLVHLFFGGGSKGNSKTRRAGFDFETRMLASTHYVGGEVE